MSLDSLFQQILLTEHQLTEQTHKVKEAKVAIIRVNEKIKASRQKYEEASQELEEKSQELCGMRLQVELIKRREEQVSRHMEELLKTREQLREQLESVKQRRSEEQQKFLEELSRFNTDMSLTADPEETMSQLQTEGGMQELLREEDMLKQEMELMSHSSKHVSCVQEENKTLLEELRGLDSIIKDLDVQLSEAEALTQTLATQIDSISRKPLTDPICLRLKKELERLKEGDSEQLREALSSEILFLQTKLQDVQRREQQQV